MTTDLHNAIETYLRKVFTRVELPTCEKYPKIQSKVTTPAVFLELSELVPADDPGTGEVALTARFTAFAITGLDSGAARLQAANLAASVALRVVEGGRFEQKVGPAKLVRVAPVDFKPDLIGYAAWAVEWTHEILLGDSTWDGEGVPVTQIMVGWSPDIGIGHKDDYVEAQS